MTSITPIGSVSLCSQTYDRWLSNEDAITPGTGTSWQILTSSTYGNYPWTYSSNITNLSIDVCLLSFRRHVITSGSVSIAHYYFAIIIQRVRTTNSALVSSGSFALILKPPSISDDHIDKYFEKVNNEFSGGIQFPVSTSYPLLNPTSLAATTPGIIGMCNYSSSHVSSDYPTGYISIAVPDMSKLNDNAIRVQGEWFSPL